MSLARFHALGLSINKIIIFSYVLTPYLPHVITCFTAMVSSNFYPTAPRFFGIIYGCPLTREEERVGQTDPSISRIQSVVQWTADRAHTHFVFLKSLVFLVRRFCPSADQRLCRAFALAWHLSLLKWAFVIKVNVRGRVRWILWKRFFCAISTVCYKWCV